MPQFVSLAATRKYRARFPSQESAVVRYFARDVLPEEVVCEGLAIHLASTMVVEALAGSGQDPAAQAIAEKYAISRHKKAQEKLEEMGIDTFVIGSVEGVVLADLNRAISAAVELENSTANYGGSALEIRRA